MYNPTKKKEISSQFFNESWQKENIFEENKTKYFLWKVRRIDKKRGR